MDIVELKKLLRIPQTDTTKDEFFETFLPLAIEFTQTHCRNNFLDDLGNLVLPGGVKLAVAKLVEHYQQQNNVASKSIADISVSYFTTDIPANILSMLKPYRKVKFV